MLSKPQTLAENEEREQPPADDLVFEARGLFPILWADPQYMPEHLAVWTLTRFGPRAGAAVEKLSARDPAPDRDELERLVITRQTRVAMAEGAFVGGPFTILLPIAFCATLLAQGQMVLELAAVAGHEPTDGIRAAELLVLLEVYPTVEEAKAALERMSPDPKSHKGKKLPRGSRWNMIVRMAYLLQVLGTGPERSRLRAALGWAGLGFLVLVGQVLPLVWVPYMAYVSRRGSLLLGGRAREYYAARKAGETGVVARGRPVVRVGGAAALARTISLVLLPIGAGLIALLAGISLTGGEWVTAGLALIVASFLATVGWLGYRWWRHRRRSRTPARAA
jgi:hypothetical protein